VRLWCGARRRLGEAHLADPAGGSLRPQVGEALSRRAHQLGEALQLGVVCSRRRDHHSLFPERLREGRHPARRRPADVGVVGAAGGEAEQLGGGEDR
jgi:hypothetical protein